MTLPTPTGATGANSPATSDPHGLAVLQGRGAHRDDPLARLHALADGDAVGLVGCERYRAPGSTRRAVPKRLSGAVRTVFARCASALRSEARAAATVARRAARFCSYAGFCARLARAYSRAARAWTTTARAASMSACPFVLT